MARKRASSLTRLNIIRTTSRLFLENGYSGTSPKMVCEQLGISPGNLTYYFSTKEDILAVFIEMLADYQWKKFRMIEDEGETPLSAICLELIAMAAMCEENEIAKDLYISAYTSDKALHIVRKNDMLRAKEVFSEFCPDWTDDMFTEAEMLVSGIEYATMRVTPDSPPLEVRIAGALNTILSIYNVPEERRELKLAKALGMDWRTAGREMFEGFRRYVDEITVRDILDVALHGDAKLPGEE